MPRHLSLLTKVRLELARVIDPFPDPGEGWCVNCSMNAGKTLILSSSSVEKHVDKHVEINPGEVLRIRYQDV